MRSTGWLVFTATILCAGIWLIVSGWAQPRPSVTRAVRRLRSAPAPRAPVTDGSLSSCEVGQEIGAVVVREAGGIVVAARDGIGVVDESTGALELIAPIAMEEKLRFAIREGGRTVGAGVVSKINE